MKFNLILETFKCDKWLFFSNIRLCFHLNRSHSFASPYIILMYVKFFLFFFVHIFLCLSHIIGISFKTAHAFRCCLYLYLWFEFETFPVTWKKIFALLMWLRLILYSSKHKARGEKKTSRRNKSKKKKPKKELSASSISSKRFVCKFSCQFICNFNSRQTMNRKRTVYTIHTGLIKQTIYFSFHWRQCNYN